MAIGPFVRILAQVVSVAGGAVARATAHAFRDAAMRGAANAASGSVSNSIRRSMSIEEAKQILSLKNNSLSRENVSKNHAMIREQNVQRDDGFAGSPYIVTKIDNAKKIAIQEIESGSGKS